MTSSFSIHLLFAVPSVLAIMAFLIAMIFALVMRSKSSRASNFVLAGLSIKLASYVISVASSWVFARNFSASELPFYIGCGNIITTSINLLGLGLILVAVFSDRGGRSNQDGRRNSSSQPIDSEALRNPEDDSNPFRTPIAN